MATPRNVSRPVVKTYITPSSTPTGTKFHVRIYAPRFDLDKRGTGSTLEEAKQQALRSVKKAPRRHPLK